MGWIVLCVLLLILGVLFMCAGNAEDEGGLIVLGLLITIANIVAIVINYADLQQQVKVSKNQYNIDLPEEIYLAKPGDTLYVNKRTKDSIYLGFKPIKTE